jgi:hypothetical protein
VFNLVATLAMCTSLAPWSSAVGALALVSLLPPMTGGKPNGEPYKPQPAYFGRKASLPPVPSLSSAPKRTPDGTYTIFGAIHDLKSRIHSSEIALKEDWITITGYIVQTNYTKASTGLVSDPANGMMTYGEIEYTTASPAPAAFPSDSR